MTAKLIGLTGQAGSGKTTAADTLVELGWVRVSMAGALKAMLRGYYDYVGLSSRQTDERIAGALKEADDHLLCGKSPRHAMQTLGTEWGRELMHQKFWIMATAAKVEGLNLIGRSVVIDDVRFQNEVDAIRAWGGCTWRIVGRETSTAAGHVSEAGNLCNLQGDVHNDATLDDLKRNMENIANEHNSFSKEV